MGIDLDFRRSAVKQLSKRRGVYVLCDLDEVPIYVGRGNSLKEGGIQGRVRRHLTSARSDIIANRQIDVWEIAWVWTYPVKDPRVIPALERALFHRYNAKSPLMQKTLKQLSRAYNIPEPENRVPVMSETERLEKRAFAFRLPRQIEHYSQVVGHFLAVKNSKEIARAIDAHFDRLARYHRELLGKAEEVEGDEAKVH